jgi:hypothetical protein
MGRRRGRQKRERGRWARKRRKDVSRRRGSRQEVWEFHGVKNCSGRRESKTRTN